MWITIWGTDISEMNIWSQISHVWLSSYLNYDFFIYLSFLYLLKVIPNTN